MGGMPGVLVTEYSEPVLESPDDEVLVAAVLDALRKLREPSDMVDALDASQPADAKTLEDLKNIMGEYFATRLSQDAAWARTIVAAANA